MLVADRIAGHTFLSSLLTSGSFVLDLGYNQGEFGRMIAEVYGCQVLGVEAVPDLVRSADVGGVRLLHAAVGSKRGTIELHLNPTACATVDGHLAQAGAQVVEVPAMTLGAILAGEGVEHVDLLKMDVEGAELEILTTADTRLLERIRQITVEFHDFLDPTMTPRVKLIMNRLEDCGFIRVNFVRGNDDVLFVKRSLLRHPRAARMWLVIRFKYPWGIARFLTRHLRSRLTHSCRRGSRP